MNKFTIFFMFVKFKVTPTLLMLFGLRYRQSYKRKLNFPITLNLNSIYNIKEVPFFRNRSHFFLSRHFAKTLTAFTVNNRNQGAPIVKYSRKLYI